MTQQDVQAAGGPSVATIRNIEGAHQTGYRREVLGRLEQALRWAPGSVQRILDGGDPEPLAVGTPLDAGPGLIRQALDALRSRAHAEKRTVGELLLDEGLVPEELVIPDALPPDPVITAINDLDVSAEAKTNLIRVYLESRAERFEEERHRRR
jgi:hypothetical protein